MKKLLLCGVLGLLGVAVSAQDAFAWGWLRNHCCHGRCSTTLTIKPYNAFSPVAYGNIVADGCLPVNMYGGQLPCQPSCFTSGNYADGSGMACGPQGCGIAMPQGGFVTGAPMQPMQMQPQQPIYFNPGNQFVVPNAQVPAQAPVGNVQMIPGVQPVGYQTQAPSYWYNNR